MLLDLQHPTHTLPLHSAAQSRAIEAAALAHSPSPPLMERAGLALARLILALPRRGAGPVLFACGPGNNGGDGLVAARLLHQHGLPVQVQLMDPSRAGSQRPADAQAALNAAQAAGVPIQAGWQAPERCSLAVDALLGLGLQRAPGGALAEAIRGLNALPARGSGCALLAVDLPSGLMADTGMPAPGDGSTSPATVVQAQHCLSLLTLKPGLFTGQGRALCGRIWFDDLGVDLGGSAALAQLIARDSLQPWLRGQGGDRHLQHKGSQGDVLVIGGAPGMRGAARLAARAALAAGAGRVYAWLLDSTVDAEVDPQRPELMRWNSPLSDGKGGTWHGRTVVCGCGGGEVVGSVIAEVLGHAERLVLDADGLNAVAREPRLRALLSARMGLGLATVLTPHPLEAARLLGCTVNEVQADRLQSARKLADQLHCTVLLKGSGSVIASPSQDHTPLSHLTPLTPQIAINSSGNAALATPGSGDVLAGWLGGLWAQTPSLQPASVAGAACHWHGLAAETQIGGPLRAADLVERMHALHAQAQA
ncbi:NAD(P)H-hydrate dehydratase [Kinneretia aquatilis]|nr:NAD(P)H-hydrate dehydratase [Paucibacter aquatile]